MTLRDKLAEIVRYFENSDKDAYNSMRALGDAFTTAIYFPYNEMFGIKIFHGNYAQVCMLNQRTAALAKIGPCILFAKTVKLPCGESVVVTIVERVNVAKDMKDGEQMSLLGKLSDVSQKAKSMKWANKHFLNDLHGGNWGTIRDRVVILDFGI